jgi:hypothetical protein
MEETSYVYRRFVEKPVRKRSLRSPRRAWLDNIQRMFQKQGLIQLAQDKVQWRDLLNTVKNLSVS